jgi:hypothetical protein
MKFWVIQIREENMINVEKSVLMSKVVVAMIHLTYLAASLVEVVENKEKEWGHR